MSKNWPNDKDRHKGGSQAAAGWQDGPKTSSNVKVFLRELGEP